MKNIIFAAIATIAPAFALADWTVDQSVNEMTDEVSSIAITTLPTNRLGNEPGLAVSCYSNSGGPYVGMITGEHIGGGSNFTKVQYRVDKDTPKTVNMLVSPDGSMVMTKEFAPQMIADFKAGKTILFSVKRYNGTYSKQRFTLAGSSAAIKKAMVICGD